MAKTKDIFLNIAANPNMTLEDLVSVGLTSENTVLLDRAQYASSEKVQEMFKDDEGNFNEQAFNTFYDIAAQSYNMLASDEANLNLMDVTAYDVDNIFVDPSKRRKVNAPQIIKLPNPDRLNVGITRIGKVGPRTQSRDEIAQTQKVLLNPTDVAKGADPIYGDSPNESWFKDFWDTRVMASWDEDGVHIDPITGKEVKHLKGDLKLNENGTYYYESLDGRSVYGKQVLNKFNTLTTDGSAWNKYDFFDSDDIEQKSIGGSVLKNLALVGSMFIPYVGWGVAAASVAHQMAGLTATFGKMLAGSDSPTLSAIEGWVKSTDRRNLKTEYAQQNMWCWENFIDLIGDTTAQLREQRAIFKFAPGIIKGDFKALSEKKMTKYADDLAKKYAQEATELSFNDLARIAQKQNPVHWKEQLGKMMAANGDIFTTKAKKAAAKYVDDYYKLGEPIARAYMTAITVQDTYGEAIQAGASDSEATLLTLGYAAAEAALLSTDLGKWIMPELRAEKQRAKTIAKKLLELPQETRELSRQVSRLEGEAKKDWAKRLFNVGKDIFKAEYSTMSKTLGSVAAQGLGEGVEEVSEELLADFSKSCFNLVQQLQGDETRMHAWDNMKDRYAMSFIGGILGGSINAAASDYKGYRELDNMTSKQAMQELIYKVRNNEMADFWKVIDKTELASKELSTQLNDSGTGYKQGTKEDNQDLEAKRALRKQVSMIESILNSESAKLDDGGFLSALIKADPSLKDLDPIKEYRMRALSNSATAGRFLNEWNVVVGDIVKTRMEIQKITSKYGDANSEKISDTDKQTLKQYEADLKKLQEKKEAMLDGGRTREYVRDALFEMTHAVKDPWDNWATEVRYAESQTGKKYSDISEEEKITLKEQYEKVKSSNDYAEQIHALADIYETLAASASDGIKESADFYEQVRKNNYTHLMRLNAWAQERLTQLQEFVADPEKGIDRIQQILNDEAKEDLVIFNGDSALRARIQELRADALANDTSEKILNGEIKKELFNSVFDQITKTCDEVASAGFIHPETKQLLEQMLVTLQGGANVALNEADDDFGFGDSALGTEIQNKINTLTERLNELDNLPSTPILANLAKFQLSTSIPKDTLQLIGDLLFKEKQNKSDIGALQYDQVTLDSFKHAEQLLLMYRSAIIGARNDSVDIDTIIGFNSTLNELSGSEESPNLAEIDAQTADLILEDVNMLLERIGYAKALHKLNTGNKFNIQDKTALNKHYIVHNKIKALVQILGDEWEDKEGETELADLKALLEQKSSTLNANAGTGSNYDSRKFDISPEDKAKIEKESLDVQKALHKFLKKHIDGSEASVNKLAKLLTYNNFKGLIRENAGYLDQNSTDIDDSAFIWWLCATAALDPHQFYNNYRNIIGSEQEGEKPIAPIPTQELGIFAMTASVVNGNMFRTFGKALRKSLNEMWENASPDEKLKIQQESGITLLSGESSKAFWKSNDFLPNFDNILFIEGIAGSGKSTGVLRSWSKLMEKSNPEFISQKILFAHTDKEKAESLAKSTSFTNYDVHDHDSLLSYMSSKYSRRDSNTYVLNKDITPVDGMIKNHWGVNEYAPNEVPKVIVIDEWSHYNQLEQDLIQDFAQKYGVTVLAMGDYDQLTPEATLTKEGSKDEFIITPFRNMTPRVAKLGVSMRTDNEIKNGNMYRMLAWRSNPSESVELHYYEDDRGIFGEKAYAIPGSYGDKLDKIKLDVQKMISTLKPNEKIGYIYHIPKEGESVSELYTWLTTTEGIKNHIQAYTEKDAHGREAQYYIIENDRSEAQDAQSYFSSVYTGITRSEQGSLVIVNSAAVGKGSKKLKFKNVQDSEMLPNTYTDEGTRVFAAKRKKVFDEYFKTESVTPFNIIPRTAEALPTSPTTSTTETPSIEDPLPTNDTSDSTTPTQSEKSTTPTSTDTTSQEETPATRTSEDSETPWKGPLKMNQVLYNEFGIEYGRIIGEEDSTNTSWYKIRKLNGQEILIPKPDVEKTYYLALPEKKKLFTGVSKVLYKNQVYEVTSAKLQGDKNKPIWIYTFGGKDYTYEDISQMHTNKELFPYQDVEEEPETTVFELGGEQEMAQLVHEITQDPEPTAITANGTDIHFNLLGFTFNNQYVADNFDDQGKIVVTPRDTERIDNGYGLQKINQAYAFESQASQFLGELRRHLEHSDNAATIKYVCQKLNTTGISMRWGFVSKTESNSGKYGRYNSSTAQLSYMYKEDHDVPQKHLSAIFYDKSGNPILEVPIITFQAPHSIFHELQRLGMASDLTDIWFNKGNQPKAELNALQKIIARINSNYSHLQGFTKLRDVLTMWLFTSNGFKILPEDFSLGTNKYSNNIGNLYITHRVSDKIADHDFTAEWVDLEKLQRKDRFISSIMMNNVKRRKDPISGKVVDIFRPYVPYVFISDDPTITNDTAAAERYLAQQGDINLPKTVKVIPVVPPEISVGSYLEAMSRVLHEGSKNEPYGNKFTPYRIWKAILQSEEIRPQVLSKISKTRQQFVIEIIKQLDNVVDTTPIRKDETDLAYKERLAAEQNKILESFTGKGDDQMPVANKLRKLLVETCYYTPFASDVRGNKDVVKLIEAACTAANITGVLCKPHFVADQGGKAIAGFGYKVRVQDAVHQKYTFPGQGSFRIFGKIDSPTYDLTGLLPIMQTWAQSAHLGKTVKNSKTGEEKHYPNMWEFTDDDGDKFYTGQLVTPNVNLTPLIQKGKDLLGKLGISTYNIDISELGNCTSESDAWSKILDQIHAQYVSNFGAFIVRDPSGNYHYGNIISEQTPEFKHFKIKNFEIRQGRNIGHFIDLSTNTPHEIEIELDLANNAFSVMPLMVSDEKPDVNITKIKDDIRTSWQNSVLGKNPKYDQLFANILECYNEETNSVDVDKIEDLLQQAELRPLTLQSIRRTLLLEELSEQSSQNVCINPKTIFFKL